jgi:hypothetical protein
MRTDIPRVALISAVLVAFALAGPAAVFAQGAGTATPTPTPTIVPTGTPAATPAAISTAESDVAVKAQIMIQMVLEGPDLDAVRAAIDAFLDKVEAIDPDSFRAMIRISADEDGARAEIRARVILTGNEEVVQQATAFIEEVAATEGTKVDATIRIREIKPEDDIEAVEDIDDEDDEDEDSPDSAEAQDSPISVDDEDSPDSPDSGQAVAANNRRGSPDSDDRRGGNAGVSRRGDTEVVNIRITNDKDNDERGGSNRR